VYSSRGESVRLMSVGSKRQRDQRAGGGADKEACTVRTVNIISQRQYFVARCLIFNASNVFSLHSICVCFTLPSS
jgi:hypothetical protein